MHARDPGTQVGAFERNVDCIDGRDLVDVIGIRDRLSKPTASGDNVVVPPPAITASPAANASPTTFAADELASLARLQIKGLAPMTGYSRTQFGPAWPVLADCDALNSVLARDLTKTTLQGGCIVKTGILVSPYSGVTISFGSNPAAVQIDHVVALADAWQTGAQTWTAAKRQTFANDLLDLLAVDAASAKQKGDADAATWLPSNKTFQCDYVETQVDVKTRYGLWVTQAEHDAIARRADQLPHPGTRRRRDPSILARYLPDHEHDSGRPRRIRHPASGRHCGRHGQGRWLVRLGTIDSAAADVRPARESLERGIRRVARTVLPSQLPAKALDLAWLIRPTRVRKSHSSTTKPMAVPTCCTG